MFDPNADYSTPAGPPVNTEIVCRITKAETRRFSSGSTAVLVWLEDGSGAQTGKIALFTTEKAQQRTGQVLKAFGAPAFDWFSDVDTKRALVGKSAACVLKAEKDGEFVNWGIQSAIPCEPMMTPSADAINDDEIPF